MPSSIESNHRGVDSGGFLGVPTHLPSWYSTQDTSFTFEVNPSPGIQSKSWIRSLSFWCPEPVLCAFGLSGRRSKGWGKGIRARDHARGRRGTLPRARPNSSFPFSFQRRPRRLVRLDLFSFAHKLA